MAQNTIMKRKKMPRNPIWNVVTVELVTQWPVAGLVSPVRKDLFSWPWRRHRTPPPPPRCQRTCCSRGSWRWTPGTRSRTDFPPGPGAGPAAGPWSHLQQSADNGHDWSSPKHTGGPAGVDNDPRHPVTVNGHVHVGVDTHYHDHNVEGVDQEDVDHLQVAGLGDHLVYRAL